MRTTQLLFLLTSLGCGASPQMQVAPDVAAEADRITIASRADGLAMGPFHASELETGWSYAHESGFGMLRREDAERTYAFVLEDDDAKRMHVACLTTERSEAIDASGLAMEERRSGKVLSCAVRNEEGRIVGRLGLPVDDEHRDGFVTVEENRLSISSETAGFEFRSRERAIGALQVADEKILWLPRSANASTRKSLAVAAAALALY